MSDGNVSDSLAQNLALRVLAFSGEKLADLPDATADWTFAHVAQQLESSCPILPGHEYRLVCGDESVTGDQQLQTFVKGPSLELIAVIQAKPSVQIDLNMALIEAAGKQDQDRILSLLAAGASAAFLHNPEGVWGSSDSKTALHMAIASKPHKDDDGDVDVDLSGWKLVMKTLLEAKSDVNAKRCESDWRGCGGSSTAFEMVLPSALCDASLLQLFLAAGAEPNTSSVSSVHSMRSDGARTVPVLFKAVQAGSLAVVQALLDARANVEAVHSDVLHNERGHNRDTKERSLHVAVGAADVSMVALLIGHAADVNAIRRELVQEHLSEEEISALEVKKFGKKQVERTDDPRDDKYICPIRCVPVEETALHIAIRKQNARLVALLVCAGADLGLCRVSHPTMQAQNLSPAELCGEDSSLLEALGAVWPAARGLFSEEELPGVEMALSRSSVQPERSLSAA